MKHLLPGAQCALEVQAVRTNMKYLAAILFAAFLAGCATQEPAPAQPTAGAGKDCVKRTGSNLCS